MSSEYFQIREHIIPSQHIREYPRATSLRQEDVLQLAIKQYIPLTRPTRESADITIIGAHANGFPKECYEPLWDEIWKRCMARGIRIRGIWIADVAHQGASGVLNEHIIGDDPSWNDHARDLLQMVNVFREDMPRPLIGIGHSMGAAQLVNLSLIHPRLLHTLVLLEPVIQQFASEGPSPAHSSTFRRDLWPSRADAIAAFRRHKFFEKWDERALTQLLTYGLRELPTAVYPTGLVSAAKDEMVTLTTTKHQEVFSFQRIAPQGVDECGKRVIDRRTHADVDPALSLTESFYRPEPAAILRQLPSLRPSVLYIFGNESNLSTPNLREEKMETTGIGVGGSGGRKDGRVDEVILDGNGHFIAMEAVEACADATSPWLERETRRFQSEEEIANEWTKREKRAKIMISDAFKELLAGNRPTERDTDKSKL